VTDRELSSSMLPWDDFRHIIKAWSVLRKRQVKIDEEEDVEDVEDEEDEEDNQL